MKITRNHLLIPAAGLLAAGLCVLAPLPGRDGGPAQSPGNTGSTQPVQAENSLSESGSSSASASNPRIVTQSTNQASAAGQPYYATRGDVKEADRILTKDGKVYPLRTYQALGVPNDPYYSLQWWKDSNNLPAVWDIPAGSRQTKIAIIDSGFALAHQDLDGRWTGNMAEQGSAVSQGASKRNCTDSGQALNRSCNNIDDNFDGIIDNETGTTTRQNPSFLNCTDQGRALNKNCNRIDDDGNGLVDDWRGWDFFNYDASVQAGEVNPAGSGVYHGTMVAGIASAYGNNGVGVSGVNWYSTILPIQALSDEGTGDSYTVANAIYYAAEQGADVISLSLGTSADDPYLREAVQYAISRGAVIVAASGNDGCDCVVYPARYPEVISVGSSNSAGARSSFSSYGAQLDILAPGESMTSTSWNSGNGSSAYATGSGTSYATPFISGIFALARSYQPDATWDEISGAMFEQANRSGLNPASPRNNLIGFGYSNANAMLSRLRSPRNDLIRYNFSPYYSGSTRAYQCQNSLPATLLYQLSKPNQLRYTVNTMSQYEAVQQGWSSQASMYVCMGLPTDTVEILRVISLPAETGNTTIKQ